MKSIMDSAIDLNLLKMLVAVARTGSVSKAGEQLGLSQPAASNALARLRQTLGDPLFVRTGTGMVPTSFAETILPDIERHLGGILEALGNQSWFDPALSRRTFNLSLSGLGEVVFLPKLAGRVFAEAPNIRIRNLSVPAPGLAEALNLGRVELAIGIIDIKAAGIRTLPLFQETYVAIVGPNFDDRLRRIEDLRAEKLVVSAPAATYASDLDAVLLQHGIEGNVVIQLGSFGALPLLLGSTDLVAIVPKQYARQLEASGQARLLPLEFLSQQASVQLVWSEKTETEPALAWLRQIIVSLFSETPASA